ncbi:MAG: HAD family hydrolase [Acutalibacteraceae bacterium]
MIKAVVFDLDHTLFDRYETLRLVVPKFREKFIIADGITDEFIWENICWADKHYVHHGWEEILSHLISAGIFKDAPSYSEYAEFIKYWFRRIAVPFKYSKGVLKEIQAMGLKTGLITNATHDIQMGKLELLGLTESFDEIIISGDTPYEKPQKEIFLLMAQKLNIVPGEMMYVGDHPKFDVWGSQNAGCVPVWVKTTGTWIFPEIEKPRLQVETVEEIPDIVRALNAR